MQHGNQKGQGVYYDKNKKEGIGTGTGGVDDRDDAWRLSGKWLSLIHI